MNSNDKKVTFAGFGILLVMIISAVALGSNTSQGEEGTSSTPADILDDFTLNRTTESFSGELQEGAAQTFEIDLQGGLLKNLTATLTWEDESELAGRPRIRRYENQPDTFSLSVSDVEGNNTDEDSGSNPMDGEGEISARISNEDQELVRLLDTEYQGEVWSVDVTMVTSGGWTPMIGIIGFNDGGNSFSLVVDYEYYDISELRGD